MGAGVNLSTIKYSGKFDFSDMTVAIVISKWHLDINEKMALAAIEVFESVKVQKIEKVYVPGSYELPLAAQYLAEFGFDGVLCLGTVIQGETRHFEFISQAVSKGIMDVQLNTGVPVSFGVLTTDNVQQAEERSGGKLGNKGSECAVALLEMMELSSKYTESLF